MPNKEKRKFLLKRTIKDLDDNSIKRLEKEIELEID